jgi:hypothetical protein
MGRIETGPISVERTTQRREIADFLRLPQLPTAAEIQTRERLREKPIPWWLREEQVDSAGNHFKGPVDPVSKLRAELAQTAEQYLSGAIIFSEQIDVFDECQNNILLFHAAEVTPYQEMVDAAIDILSQIGFKPPEPIKGGDWILFTQLSGHFPTIFPDIQVGIERDAAGVVTEVALLVEKTS